MSMLRLLGAALSAAALLPVHAAVVYDESISGDLPNNGAFALPIPFALGSNVIRGTTGNPGTGVDRDYFTFTLPAGWRLDSLTVLSGTTALGGGSSFIGVQAGPQVTVDPNSGSAVGLLGWTLYMPGDIGSDILPRMGIPDVGSDGFTPPLPAGTYAFWIQETAAGTSAYHFDFTVSAVPEPGPALLLAGGLAVLALRRRLRAG